MQQHTRTFRALVVAAVALTVLIALSPQPAPPPPATEEPDPQEQSLSSPLEALALASLTEAVIHHRDGRVIQGELLEEDEYRIVINLTGIRTEILRADINSMRRLPPALVRYRTVRDSIHPDDLESRFALIAWLRDRQLFAEALEEVEVILEAEPSSPRAKQLSLWLNAQLRLRRVSPRPKDHTPDRAESLDLIRNRGARRTSQPDHPVLTKDQINRIRVYEVNLADPPRITISRKTLEKLYQSYGSNSALPQTRSGREALARQPGHEILDLMFRLKARELYPEARVIEDPEALRVFREKLHGRAGWLINACGSVRCHGGTEAGRFQLVTKRAHSDEAVYTNFYVLDQFNLEDGTPLINYDEPAQSPLLQLATRRENSTFPHPPTGADRGPRAWRPIFATPSDQKFSKAVEWIGMLYRPRPDYGIEFVLPGHEAPEPKGDQTTQPASTPPESLDQDPSEDLQTEPKSDSGPDLHIPGNPESTTDG